jgi:hypothetical protein
MTIAQVRLHEELVRIAVFLFEKTGFYTIKLRLERSLASVS